MLPALMEPAPAAPRSFPPAQAGAFLIVVTALVIATGTVVGWALGSPKNGLIVGAILGVPAGIGAVYARYRGYFT
jgi:hypothetical protein